MPKVVRRLPMSVFGPNFSLISSIWPEIVFHSGWNALTP
jgi:hypothetical protein